MFWHYGGNRGFGIEFDAGHFVLNFNFLEFFFIKAKLQPRSQLKEYTNLGTFLYDICSSPIYDIANKSFETFFVPLKKLKIFLFIKFLWIHSHCAPCRISIHKRLRDTSCHFILTNTTNQQRRSQMWFFPENAVKNSSKLKNFPVKGGVISPNPYPPWPTNKAPKSVSNYPSSTT